MSWNKNTVDLSEVDAAERVLRNLKIPYHLSTLKKVQGRGLNDTDDSLDNLYDLDNQKYLIRRLQYRDIVLLEQMVRTCDCDADDVICSYTFNLTSEPKVWIPEVKECVCGYNCIDYNTDKEGDIA